MCALFGFLDYGKKIDFFTKRKIIKELSVAAEIRGTDATGIAYVKNADITIFKKAKPAHKVDLYFPADTVCVMGHTRMTTQGNEKFNQNNHPFLGHADKDFAFAHNGVIYNDSLLRKSENLPDTEIETDSYVAVQLIEKQKSINFSNLKTMAEKVAGSFMFTVLDENNKLYFVKGSNPIYIIHFEKLGLYIYASTKEIVEKAISKTALKFSKYTVINISAGEMLSIDKNGVIKKSFFDYDDYSYLYKSYSEYDWYDFYSNQSESAEDVLLQNCQNFGLEPDDVFALLDYGYEPEDIEDMLYEPGYLSSCVREMSR